MNQSDLVQKIILADRQAQAIAQEARRSKSNMDEQITSEISAMETQYQQEAEEHLRKLEQSQKDRAGTRIKALDRKLEKNLGQVESLYEAKKEEWVDAIVERIVGKAGG